MIRDYGILNTEIEPGDAFLYGIPFPGVFVTNREGRVVGKFFHDSYKKRDSPEMLIDAALGRIVLSDDTPRASGGDADVGISVTLHGGKGSLRQGMRRQVVVRFALGEGLHVYGEPVPEGMIPTTVTVTGPPGLVVEAPILPPSEPLHLEEMGVELQVYSGTVDIVVPVYAVGELASEVRPLDTDRVTLDVSVRYQACDDRNCLLPKTEHFSLDVPLDLIDIPAIGLHRGHGQREGAYDGTPHLRRLFLRKIRKHPLGFLRYIAKSIRLELAAWRRQER